MNQTLKCLGIFLSSLSLISVFQQLFSIGLSGIFFSVIDYYRLVISTIFSIINIEIPQMVLDLWTISFIASAAYVKVNNIEKSRALQNFNLNYFQKHWRVIYFFVLGFSFVGLGIFLALLNPMTYVDEMNESPNDLLKKTVPNLILVIAALILFFLLNAYSPSL